MLRESRDARENPPKEPPCQVALGELLMRYEKVAPPHGRGVLQTARVFAVALDKHFDATITALRGWRRPSTSTQGISERSTGRPSASRRTHEEWARGSVPRGEKMICKPPRRLTSGMILSWYFFGSSFARSHFRVLTRSRERWMWSWSTEGSLPRPDASRPGRRRRSRGSPRPSAQPEARARELLRASLAAPEWPKGKRDLVRCAELRRAMIQAGWFN